MSGKRRPRPSDFGVAVLVVVMAVTLGCKAKAKAPAVAAAPAVRGGLGPEPLSAPQTTVRLPPSQPVPPEAIPPEQEAHRPVAAAEDEALPRPAGRPVGTASRPRPVPAAPPTPPVAGPAPARPSAAPQLRPLLTPEEEQELQRRIDQSLASAEQSLVRVRREPLTKDRQAAAERVRAFIEQAQQARRQGDLVRARSLAERAELLALDLARAPR